MAFCELNSKTGRIKNIHNQFEDVLSNLCKVVELK